MIYLRARYYNSQIGRFTSCDIEEGEISNPLDMNRYVYCRNNPIKYVDPSGEAVWVIVKPVVVFVAKWAVKKVIKSLLGLDLTITVY